MFIYLVENVSGNYNSIIVILKMCFVFLMQNIVSYHLTLEWNMTWSCFHELNHFRAFVSPRRWSDAIYFLLSLSLFLFFVYLSYLSEATDSKDEEIKVPKRLFLGMY